jgi:hypothetical protein
MAFSARLSPGVLSARLRGAYRVCAKEHRFGVILFVQSSKAVDHPTRGETNYNSERRNANEPYYDIKITLKGGMIAPPRKVA